MEMRPSFFSGAHRICELVCKPGSVLNDHLSVACRCRQAQAASSERSGKPMCSSTALLRIEFTAPACLHAAGELLPRLSTLTGQKSTGGISLLHLSEGHPWRALPVILALWSPDFPHAWPFDPCPRSFGPLAKGILSRRAGIVKAVRKKRGKAEKVFCRYYAASSLFFGAFARYICF